MLSLDHVLAEIDARESVRGIRLVGVDGPAGSGKSTLARRLAAIADARVVAIDDFTSWVDFAGWWPRFERQVLEPLLAGADARYQVRDWVNDEYGDGLAGWKTVAWSPLVFFEGVTCTRRATESRLVYRIWVEAPRDLRRERGIARDGEMYRDLWLRWMADEDAFFPADGARDRADLLVDGAATVPYDPDTEIVTLQR